MGGPPVRLEARLWRRGARLARGIRQGNRPRREPPEFSLRDRRCRCAGRAGHSRLPAIGRDRGHDQTAAQRRIASPGQAVATGTFRHLSTYWVPGPGRGTRCRGSNLQAATLRGRNGTLGASGKPCKFAIALPELAKGTAEEVPDEQVIAAVKSVPCHY